MQKLLNELERDIRNQVRFNSMLRLNRRQRIMVQFQRAARFNYVLALGALFCAIFWIVLCMTIVHAEDAIQTGPSIVHAQGVSGGSPGQAAITITALQCPTPGERCKILYLSEQEERMLMSQNGILDTAAQARAIDLGQFSVYLKTRIAGALAGEVKAVPAVSQPAPQTVPVPNTQPTEKSLQTDKPVDNPK